MFLLSLLGAQAGTVLSMPVSGILADEVSWESVFYVFGALGCVWFALWCFLVYDNPDTHPRISEVRRKRKRFTGRVFGPIIACQILMNVVFP